MKIRLAKDEDYAKIASLRRQTIRNVNSNDYPEETILDWTTKANTQTFRDSANKVKRWVAIENGEIIGFCEHNFKCELSRIYVHKDYLRKGVGSRLIGIAEDSLIKQGCKEIKIESTITAKNFYEKNGYKSTKKTLCTVVRGSTVFIMCKKVK